MADHGLPDRRSIRLPGWDYRRAGWYFVTINTRGSCHTLAHVHGGRMVLTRMGAIVARCWRAIPDHHPAARLDEFVVMPNHIHGIVIISRSGPAGGIEGLGYAAGSLAAIVGSYKASCTRGVRAEVDSRARLWQRNFYERILVDREAIDAVRGYIRANASRWIATRHRPR
jgi:REP element-mobilizing transposase RayT